jgi:HTH-type transcriptional regulator / antitoxin HigA
MVSADYAVAPGETVLEVIEALGLTQSELAERTGRPKKTINEIINGKAAITPETALQFERVLRLPASFWTSLEHDYRAALARGVERERLREQVGWLSEIPVKAMIKAGWLEAKTTAVEQLDAVLSFFGVASVEAWRDVWSGYRQLVAFRESPSFDSDFGAVTAWLRQSELEARAVETQPYDAAAFREALAHVRGLTAEDPEVFCPQLVAFCAQAGVAVVFVRELPHLRVCGATRWLGADKAMISLTLRYKRDDHLWFTFFHEAAHILLHGKRAVFVEQEGRAVATDARTHDELRAQEEDANSFSRDFLIPPEEYRRFRAGGSFSADAVRAFAQHIGIAPGIVVGRLQYDRVIPFPTRLNGLKRSFTWAE